MDYYRELEEVVESAFGTYGLTEQSITALGMLLDNRIEGLIIVDEQGRVVYMNRENERFLGLGRGEAKGRHVTELIPSSRLHIVCKTGEAEIGHIQEISGKIKVSSRVPIRKDGRVIGAMGSIMFRDIKEVDKLTRRLQVLEDRVANYRKKLKAVPYRNRYTFDNILGEGAPIREAVAMAENIATSETDVAINGETGTGKELFAHAIHNASPRGAGPFVRLNCASIPRELAESELFGYEPGSFTGGRREGKLGKFEQAHGGTIFLDEIGDLPLDIQAKLLRVLQEREVERIGATSIRYVDFRLIAASNLDLQKLCTDGKFRVDLYYRLNKMLIAIPPLREHPEDIPLYVRHFLDHTLAFDELRPKEVGPEAMAALQAYSWPGNIRELNNVVERIAWNVKHPLIRLDDLPSFLLKHQEQGKGDSKPMALRDAVEEAEKAMIRRVLTLTNNNKSRACKLLDIHRTTLYEKLSKYGFDLS